MATAALRSSGEAATVGWNRNQDFLWDDMQHLLMPVDMVIGANDTSIPSKLGHSTGAEMAFSRLQTPGRLVVVHGGDHGLPFKEVEAFNSVILGGALLSPAVDHDWASVVQQMNSTLTNLHNPATDAIVVNHLV